MTREMHVVHVDDSAALRDITAELLERVDDRIVVHSVADPTEVPDLIDDEVDCVVSDYRMPGMDGLELCASVREDHPDLPFFLFTSVSSEELVDDAMAAGVTDFVQKDPGITQYKILANRIRHAVQHYRIRQRVENRTSRE